MVFSNVNVDVTIPRRSFMFGQSRAKVSAGFTNLRSLAVAAFDLVYCSLSGLRFVFVATTIRTFTRPAQPVCDSPDSLQDETDYHNNVLIKNNYNTDFVRRNTHSNTDSNTQTNVKSGPVTTATVPYIRGTSENIARRLQPYSIRVAHKLISTLRRLLTYAKDKDKPEDRQRAVYKIKCCHCQAS